MPFHPFWVGTRSFPQAFPIKPSHLLNPGCSKSLANQGRWWNLTFVFKQEENKADLSKQRDTTSPPSNEFQLYPSRRLSEFQNSCWKLIKDKNLRTKSTVQVLCSSHLPGEQVLCCCQVADVHPRSFQRQQSSLKHTSDAGIPFLPRAIVPAEGFLTKLEGWQSIPAAPEVARSHKELRQTSSGTAKELLGPSCRNNSQRNIQPTAAPLRSPQTGITSSSFSSWLENRPSERAWIHPSIYSIKFHFFAIWKKNFHVAISTAPAVFPGNGGEIKPLKLCSGMPTWIKPHRPKCFLSVLHIP